MFIGLSDEALDKVAQLCTPKTYPPDAIIVKYNAPPDNFFLIQDGTVEIITDPEETEDKSDSVVVTLGTGQSFGEMGLVDSGTRSATVKTTTHTSVLAIDCQVFLALCESDTDLGYHIMRNIAADLSFKLRYRNLI